MWQKINPVGVEELENTRIHLHKALQLVGSASRSYLPFNKGDNHKYLIWKPDKHMFISKPFGHDKAFCLSLDINQYVLSIIEKDGAIEHLVLSGMTYQLAFGWIQVKLDKFGLDPVLFSDQAPYEIKDYGFDSNKELHIYEHASEEICKYFNNASSYFEFFLNNYELKSPVLCDPQSFNLFVSIKLPETSKKIQIGFCPGDENYIEPYYYIKLSQNIKSTSGLPELSRGLWHNKGWSGALILYSDITNIETEKEFAITRDFFEEALKAINDID